jgi:hypothetical protein
MKLPLANAKYRRPATIVSRLLLFSALAVWLAYIGLWLHYDSTRPGQPDVAAGRILVQNTHGHYVYLTPEESTRLTDLEILAAILFVSGFLILGLFAENGFTRKRPKPWEVRRW